MTDPGAVAVLVCQVASEVQLPLFRQGVIGEDKSPRELVSRVDRESECLLTEGLADLTPGVAIVGEESASDHPAVLAALPGDQPV